LTRLAIVTDVHADVHALRDALSQIDRLGVDQILCCGDLVDYGLFPDETIALLRERRVVTIRGNHDRWALEPGGAMRTWDLSPASVTYLEALPTGWRKFIDGARVVLAHARPGSDMRGIARDTPAHVLMELLDETGADILLVGHTHAPFIRRLGEGRLVANPGALLRDPAPGVDVLTPGTFAVIDVTSREYTVHHAKDGDHAALPPALSLESRRRTKAR
jgi:putative phosphoesterase